MKLTEIKNPTEIRINDNILWHDKKTGKIRGIDKVTEINSKDLSYRYRSHDNLKSNYANNLSNFMKQCRLYRIEDKNLSFLNNVSEDSFNSAILILDDIFEDLFGNIGKALYSFILNKSNINLFARETFVKTVNEYKEDLLLIKFENSEDYFVSSEKKKKIKNILSAMSENISNL